MAEVANEVAAKPEPTGSLDDLYDDVVELTPAPKPVEAAKVETPTEPEKPKTFSHPASLRRSGRAFGLTEDRMAAMTPEALDALVDGFMERAQAEREHAAQVAAAATPEPESDDFSLGDIEGEMAPNLIAGIKAAIRGQAERVATKKVAAVERKLEEATQAEQRRQNASAEQQVDAGFAALNSPLLGGAKPGRELDKASLARRRVVLADLAANPIPGMAVADAVRQRSKELFAITDPEVPKKKDEKLEAEAAKWAAAGMAPPTGTAQRPARGVAAARKAVGEQLKDMGVGVAQDDDYEEGGL